MHGDIRQIRGSCLRCLPSMESESVDAVLTSPPYANRYDYTRTYALELAFCGFDDSMVKLLRQDLLTSTVENKSKDAWLRNAYRENRREQDYGKATVAFQQCAGAVEAYRSLLKAGIDGKLNNDNVPHMVQGYMFEMNL